MNTRSCISSKTTPDVCTVVGTRFFLIRDEISTFHVAYCDACHQRILEWLDKLTLDPTAEYREFIELSEDELNCWEVLNS